MEEPQPAEPRPREILGGLSLIVLLAALVADQFSKYIVLTSMYPGQSIPETGLFRITYVTNTGSAFGLFPNQTFYLIIASFVGIAILLVFYHIHRVSSPILRISLGLQLGGAIGNLMDRLRLGYVVDFLDVGAWPVFNLADSAIVVGLVGLVFTMLTTSGGQERFTQPDEYLFPMGLTIPEPTLTSNVSVPTAEEDAPPVSEEEPWKTSDE